MGKDSAARIELGRSFQQMGTVNEKVCESDFVPLWDGIVMHRSLAEQYTILQLLSNRYRKTSLLRRKRSLTATNRIEACETSQVSHGLQQTTVQRPYKKAMLHRHCIVLLYNTYATYTNNSK